MLADPSGRRAVKQDQLDNDGQLCLASMLDGEPVGVVRSIALSKGFPRRELLEHHLDRPEVQDMWKRLGALNALAVLSPYRGQKYQAVDLGWSGSVAKLLMLFAMREMERHGLQAALATTGNLAPMRPCRHLGFCLIDPPRSAPHLTAGILTTNVGIVFGSPLHLQAQRECASEVEAQRPLDASSLRLLNYFEEQQAKGLESIGK